MILFFLCPYRLPAIASPSSLRRGGRGWKDKTTMPPKAAHESSRVKPEMSSMTHHRNAATQMYFARGAGFFFLSFVPARLASQPACQAERGGQGESVAGRRNLRKEKKILLIRYILSDKKRPIDT